MAERNTRDIQGKDARLARIRAAEGQLWLCLRQLRKRGFHFRRQVPIGRYIADFACHRAKLIVEVDGSQHGNVNAMAYDTERSAFLESRGYKVFRFWNSEVLDDPERIVEIILGELIPTRPSQFAARSAKDDLPARGR
jgi:very-short-patch-repair endonuclease